MQAELLEFIEYLLDPANWRKNKSEPHWFAEAGFSTLPPIRCMNPNHNRWREVKTGKRIKQVGKDDFFVLQ